VSALTNISSLTKITRAGSTGYILPLSSASLAANVFQFKTAHWASVWGKFDLIFIILDLLNKFKRLISRLEMI
jgi:hypothetical protein